MAGSRVKLNDAALARLLSDESGPVGKLLAGKAIKVEGAAKRLCPVDTGRLRSSITHSIEHDSLGLVAFIGTNVEYAIYQELGTKFQRPQPYLRPALRAAR